MMRSLLLLCIALLTACGGDNGNPITNAPDARLRWVYTTGQNVYYGSPALSLDGQTVYVGTSDPLLQAAPKNHSLRAIDVATGTLRWSFNFGFAEVRSSPAVGPDGSITVLVEERNSSGGFVKNEVVRVTSAGALQWRRELGIAGSRVDVGFSAPAVGTDGSVYVATDSLYALSADGTIRWSRFFTGEDLRASATLASDGTVYFASHNIPLTAMHPDSGRVLWSLPLGPNDHVFAAPSIGSDGTIYVGTNDCVVYAVSSAGALQWSRDLKNATSGCSIRSSPAIAADGTIVFGTVDRTPRPAVFALRSDGTVRWTFAPTDLPPDVDPSNFDIYSSPAIGSDGAVYFGHEFGRVYALDLLAGSIRWMVRYGIEGGITWSSPTLTANGVLLINDLQGRLYALTTESIGLQGSSPWPRYRGTNRSAGRR